MAHGILVFDEDMEDQRSLMSFSHSFDYLSGSWTQSTPQSCIGFLDYPSNLSMEESSLQVNLIQAFQTLPALGLKLSRTSSFLDRLDQMVQEQNSNGENQANSNSVYAAAKVKAKEALQQANKLKAENFPIALLRVGSWQRVSRNEGDLVAKCYFAKRKLVWEFLEHGLKSKIEIQWSDILSLKAVIQEDKPGILEIELNQPPSFHHEIDPQPRKHTQWRMVSDFTGGQAPTFRRHYLEFPPGALDRPIEKLFRCDNRLFQLSRQGYPTLESPYFQKYTYGIDLSFDFGGQGAHVNPDHQQQFSFSNAPSHFLSQRFQTYEQTAQKSVSTKDSDSPISDEHISNHMPVWGQGTNNVRDSLNANQVGGMAFTAAPGTQVNPTICLQNNHMPAYVQEAQRYQLGGLVPAPSTAQVHNPTLVSLQEAERHQPRFQRLNDLQNMLLSNSPTGFSDVVAEGNLFREGNPANYTSNVTAFYGQDMVDNPAVIMSNNLSNSNGRLISPHAACRPQPLVPNSNMNLQPGNNSFYSPVVPDLAVQYFSNPHASNEFNDWA
ncbi:uncharacterized protein LOC110415970 isoform X3 [Herrania umbratica]|uniref:Uncharacterized protein LOC110415970 isoform X3 n=1 Tax=Herrania umbratica TaxID=108875 RepID=A0A6J1A9C5_9ROSI|nr:uncharacterized protein LOC110415970 isoform X3 [Herrania umbratica]